MKVVVCILAFCLYSIVSFSVFLFYFNIFFLFSFLSFESLVILYSFQNVLFFTLFVCLCVCVINRAREQRKGDKKNILAMHQSQMRTMSQFNARLRASVNNFKIPFEQWRNFFEHGVRWTRIFVCMWIYKRCKECVRCVSACQWCENMLKL